jgi:hypothetical protein
MYSKSCNTNKKLPTNNTVPSKAILQKGKRNKDPPSQAKPEGIHEHQASLMKDA